MRISSSRDCVIKADETLVVKGGEGGGHRDHSNVPACQDATVKGMGFRFPDKAVDGRSSDHQFTRKDQAVPVCSGDQLLCKDCL